MDNETLKKLQSVETGILAVFDEFCRKHGLKYSLFAGTALGAVRHGGFIPWDDDIDVCMERSEYERFLELWEEEGNQDDYFLYATDDPGYRYINHSKLRKYGTMLATEWEYKTFKCNGIWLDIFPIDKVPTDKKKRKKYLRKNKFRMIYTRGYPLKGRGFVYYLITKLLLLKSLRMQFKKRNKLDEYIKSTKDLTSGFEYMCLASMADLAIKYPPNLFDEYIDIDFEGHKFSIVKDYHTMLTNEFGDYMQLPPEEERVCKHNPKYVRFDS